MYRIDRERVGLDLDGPSVEVQPIVAWPVFWTGVRLSTAYDIAKDGQSEMAALESLYAFVASEAQPVWDLADHHGPIPPTALGFLRIELELALKIVAAWLGTLNPPTTAVDELIPAGGLRDALNADLKRKRARRG